MNTIYSRIIWEELGMSDYKIHEMDFDTTRRLILEWVKNTDINKVNEVLSELSWVRNIQEVGYYDGPFYGINQRDEKQQYDVEFIVNQDQVKQPDITIHDVATIPFILYITINTCVSPSELRFTAVLLEAYKEKIPKETCRIQ